MADERKTLTLKCSFSQKRIRGGTTVAGYRGTQDCVVKYGALSLSVRRLPQSEYLSLMVAGIPRYGLNGEVKGSVTKDEQAYAFEKMSAIWKSRVKTIMSNGEVPWAI